jgi:hypothetical protein
MHRESEIAYPSLGGGEVSSAFGERLVIASFKK